MTDPSEAQSPKPWVTRLFLHDLVLITLMAVLAACGLIYEYLLSHYAGRVLGSMESTIYAIIGLMIVAMGVGAFSAQRLTRAFTAFAWLEVIVAMSGMTAVLLIAGLIALTHILPQTLSQVFNLPGGLVLNGGLFLRLNQIALLTPYFAAFVLGFLIGMEIPLIARIREQLHSTHLTHNVGTIYGADYIGAGAGAGLWVWFMLRMEITEAAVWTAAANLLAGMVFLIIHRQRISHKGWLWSLHGLLAISIIILAQYGSSWMTEMSNLLYKDQVVYTRNTPYQHITFTERRTQGGHLLVTDMYLNGRLQFSSADEHIYHSMLVYPAMLASARHDEILLIGGGDGLALRNVLRWNPKAVTLVDLDPDLVGLYSETYADDHTPPRLHRRLLELNQGAFDDPRVKVIFADAFVEVERLLDAGRHFDTIIVDLPDPSHPDLNKLYSTYFYNRLRHLLSGDGALVVQSTSPFHAQKAFISVGKTLKEAGFDAVEQYRQNVPTFGEWGWTLGTKRGQPASQRLARVTQFTIPDPYVTPGLIRAAFEFPADFYQNSEGIKANHLGSGVIYKYHQEAWTRDEGAVFFESSPPPQNASP